MTDTKKEEEEECVFRKLKIYIHIYRNCIIEKDRKQSQLSTYIHIVYYASYIVETLWL